MKKVAYIFQCFKMSYLEIEVELCAGIMVYACNIINKRILHKNIIHLKLVDCPLSVPRSKPIYETVPNTSLVYIFTYIDKIAIHFYINKSR